MTKKIILIISCTLFFLVALLSVPLTFTQQIPFDYCKVSVYGTLESQSDVGFQFIAVAPPNGTDVPNSINMINYISEENYTEYLSPGDRGQVVYLDRDVLILQIEPASEPNHFTILFEGGAEWVRINNADIPEFPPILAVPLFMTATLLAILYRRKRISRKME